MPYAILDGGVLFFAHVPKSGGSSVEAYMEARFGPLAMLDRDWSARWRRGGGRREASLRSSPQHVTAAEAERLLPPLPRRSFAVVRDPVSRLASEYRFQTQLGALRRAPSPGFSLWLHAMLTAARREPTVFDNHLRPQTDLVPGDAEIFRLEDGLEAVAAWLDDVAGTPAPGGLRMGRELKTSGGPVRLTRRDAAAIRRFYAADYARFGYPLPAAEESAAGIAGLGACLAGWPAGWGLVLLRRWTGLP